MHRTTRIPPFRLGVALLSVCLGLAACGDDGSLGGESSAMSPSDEEADTGTEADTQATGDTADGDLPLIVATTSIVGDVVGNVVGDEATLEVLMPAGVDPHAYQPSGADAATLREADLVVTVGLGLEENLVDAIAGAAAEGVRVLALAEHLDPLEFAEDEPADDEHADDEVHADDDGHGHGPLDPHVWLDPVRMAEGAALVATELGNVAEGGWQDRAAAYADELLAVHAELEEQFAALPEDARRLVTNHDALGYLAVRYDLDVIGTVIPGTSTQAEADARTFAALADTIDRAGVTAIFTENIASAGLADQLAAEVAAQGGPHVDVVSLYTDALGEPGSGAETYVGLLRENGRRILEALG